MIIGFVILIKGADMLVDGASFIAKKYDISDLVIGLTIVAFGTSAPELAINVIASFEGKASIAIGNILGSNISNIFLILGVSAIIYPLTVNKVTVWREIPFGFLITLVLGFLANDVVIDGMSDSRLTRIDGLVLIAFFFIFIYYTFATRNQSFGEEIGDIISKIEGDEEDGLTLSKSILWILVGLVGLTLGGKFIVDGAIFIASAIGFSESIIGLTVVAIGTSLPELATSAMAAFKKKTDIAVGNVVGSNVFNILWVLGISSIIRPLPFYESINVDIFVTILASLLLFVFIFTGEKHRITKRQGYIFVIIYFLYIGFLVFNEIG